MPHGAILDTRWLPERMKRNLANGLDALHLELVRNRGAGYGGDMTKGMREALVSDARQAYALGIISYLPAWAKVES